MEGLLPTVSNRGQIRKYTKFGNSQITSKMECQVSQSKRDACVEIILLR